MKKPAINLFVNPSCQSPYINRLSAGIAARGYRVKLLPVKPESIDELEKEDLPAVLHFQWTHNFFGKKLKTYQRPLRFMRMCLKLIKKRLQGFKVVWTIHNLSDHENTSPWLDWLSSWFLSECSDQIIVHCKHSIDLISKQFPVSIRDKIEVIPHGHFIGVYPNKMPRKLAREQLGIPADKFVFLFVGQIRPYKGCLRLISDFLRFEDKLINSCLLIAGKIWAAGSDKKFAVEIMNAVEKSNKIYLYPNFIKSQEFQKYINASDVFVLPFEDILNSGSMILGMSFRKPCIVPAIGCLPLLTRQQRQLVYNPKIEDALADKMKFAYENRREIEKMGQENFKFIQQYDWPDIAEKTCNIYQKIIK